MNTPPNQKLDALLAELPRSIEPAHDLWPGIAARLDRQHERHWPHTAWNMAAAAAVIGVAVLIAWVVAPAYRPLSGTQPFAAATAPKTHGTAPDNSDPRTLFMAQLASDSALPPNARDAFLKNLRMLHENILRSQAAVKKYPDDLNLRALLFNLYQQQAQLLDEAQRAQIQTSVRTAT